MKLGYVVLLIFGQISFQNCQDFVATEEWQEIKEGQKVPGGLHYRMNLETGKKEAKILTENSDEKEKVPILSDQNEKVEENDKLSDEKVKEMQEIIEKLKMNKDVENIKFLMGNFANSSIEEKMVILEDLDFYMHQIDNAQDFVTLNGLEKIILPCLTSENPDLIAKGAILLGIIFLHIFEEFLNFGRIIGIHFEFFYF